MTTKNIMAAYLVPKKGHDPTGPHPFEGTHRKMYGSSNRSENYRDDTLTHDTPVDCLFDDDPENPRPRQTLEGLDKSDYDHWTQRHEDGRLAATGRTRRNR